MRVSFIIPVYNEAESLRELHGQILAAVNALPGNVNRERREMFETPLTPPEVAVPPPVGDAGEPAATDVYKLQAALSPPAPAVPTPSPAAEPVEAEILFVDDGSTDASWEEIQRLSQLHEATSGIRFRRNFGKASALAAGFQAMTGDVVMTLDADLQDDPAELGKFLNKLGSRYDVVNGWKERRLDPWHKVYPSKVFNWLVSTLTGLKLHDHNCGLKVFRAEVARELRLYGELHRFIPVLAHARGFRVTELPVQHRPRQFGQSKYGFRRFARGFLDLLTVTFLTSYGQRPQHILGGVGLASLAVGLLGMGYLAFAWVCMNVLHLFESQPIGTRPLLAYSIGFTLLGGQALSLGLLAEMIVHHSTRDQDRFVIAEQTARPRQEPTRAGSVP